MGYEKTDDSDLVAACLSGDEQAWEKLINKYLRLIYSTCRQYGLEQDEADEVFGRVCLIIFENLEKLKDYTRLSAWLITITSRECWQYKKSLKKVYQVSAQSGSVQVALEELEDGELLPEDKLLLLEYQQSVREAIKKLSPRCQKLLWYLFYDPAQLSYTEIAAALQMPCNSIGSTRNRCLEKLRIELESF